MAETDPHAADDIAIVGMAAHLPGAQTIEVYWQNLRDGIRSIRKLSETELLEAGENPARVRHPNYVPHAAPLDGLEMFDGDFFGFGPKESAILDPQHRRFLEVAWEALENAGHPPESVDGPVGVFAGCGQGTYYWQNILSNPDLVEGVGHFLLRHTGNDKDFLSTRLSHVLNLTGPSLTLQTACSTSLVATHYAVQALLNGECDMALAGGVTIEMPNLRGYLYKEGEILSPDGECHAFDHRAQGTVFGSGAGVVVLRRLGDAVADGDHIWAVIKGSAVNNDGSDKAGYLAPSVGGQAAAIAEAQAVAGITADTVDYVECHGTGTYLGDPIEVQALTEGFRETTAATGFARIGSVKTNIGHLDTAAGVASLIKTSLALHHRQMPPSLGYEAPNPAIDFENSPFSVNDSLTEWPRRDSPRRAGVNSLGVGGTNAHVVLEEAPTRAASEPSDWPFQLLTLSARSKAALDGNTAQLARHLRQDGTQDLADVAFTLKEGRRAFERRRVVVARNHAEATALLDEMNPRRVFTHEVVGDDPDVVFMFPGGGAQYAGMARDLYETEPEFRDWMDRGLEILAPRLDYDIRALWLPETEAARIEADEVLRKPSVQLPLILIVEYALARLWMSWGVSPAALIGHSMGENTAACVAGVMSLEDCIGLVHLRGTLFDTVPAGGMLSVALPAQELLPYLGDDLDLASVNAPGLSVASGPDAALDALAERLAADGHDSQRVPIDIAAHSRMLEPILRPFEDYLRSITLSAPEIPFISNRTGDWITEAEATDPAYWVAHLRGTVHFADGLTTLADEPRAYLEVGPGKALSSLAQAHDRITGNQVIGSLRHPQDDVPDDEYFVAQLGRLWAVGVEVDWTQIWGEARRNRVVLPTYAFQHKPYYIEPGKADAAPQTWLERRDDVAEWGWAPAWRPRLAECLIDADGDLSGVPRETWLMFVDDAGVGRNAATRLRDAGHKVVEVRPGDSFASDGPDRFSVSPEQGRAGYDQLIRTLVQNGVTPTRIAHFWLVTKDETHRPGSSFFHRNLEQGFFGLMFLAQALASENLPACTIQVFASDAVSVRGEPLAHPEKATVTGPVQVIPREMPGMRTALIDIRLPKGRDKTATDDLNRAIIEELLAPVQDTIAAIRGQRRYVRDFLETALAAPTRPPIEQGARVLITGGFGGIGISLAEHLIESAGARIGLLSRSPLPERHEWKTWVADHGPHDATSRRIAVVERLEALGGEVIVTTADVSNVEDMGAARDRLTSAWGGVDVVIHAAGVIDDGPLLAKTPASVEDVFTPKIHGTQVLAEVFPDGMLDLMVLFASTSTVTAPPGQIDYVAANAYLNAFAESRAGGKTRVVALNWGIWNEVGMAAEAVATREAGGPRALPVPVAQPMLETAGFDDDGHRVFTADWNTDHWYLGEHRTGSDDALLPGTGYLELASQALRAQGESGSFAVRDLYFLRPLDVSDGADKTVRVKLVRSDAGYDFEVWSAAQVAGRTGWALHAQAALELARIVPAPRRDIDALSARLPMTEQAAEGALTAPQEAHLHFGPRWRVLRARGLHGTEGLARLALPVAVRDTDADFALHPALLDIATGWAMGLIDGYQGRHLWVPMSYGNVRVHAPLTPEIFSHVTLSGSASSANPVASFDIVLMDTDGRVLVEIEAFSIKRLDNAKVFARPVPLAVGDLRFDADQQTGNRSPAEEKLATLLAMGIRPAEGSDAFVRAIAAGPSQIIVSSLGLPELIAETERSVADQANDGQSFDRPDLDSEYAAPEGDVERTLAGFWQELLGVADPGAMDSFFDMGGHSLIAVRLFAMVKRAYKVDFPISVLFEAPTIRKIAAQIEERIGPQGDGDTTGPKPDAPASRYRFLVPMHEGEGGSRTPFFLVAGMFGNVLNLRHLAHLLGQDRPFYGLQARGLLGGDAPHTDLVEAARDYIEELRQVRPHGPYLLGGFSGGGITAYEMARQLEAAGEKVDLVVMLDTPLPQRRPLGRLDRLRIQWQELRARGPLYPFIWARNRLRWEIAKRRQRPEETETAGGYQDAAIEAAFYEAIARYEVHGWNGALKLFRPPLRGKWTVGDGRLVSDERAYVLADNDWTQFVPTLEVFEVPGDHDSMVLEPNVRVLAARMKRCIDAAETNAAGRTPARAGRGPQAAE